MDAQPRRAHFRKSERPMHVSARHGRTEQEQEQEQEVLQTPPSKKIRRSPGETSAQPAQPAQAPAAHDAAHEAAHDAAHEAAQAAAQAGPSELSWIKLKLDMYHHTVQMELEELREKATAAEAALDAAKRDAAKREADLTADFRQKALAAQDTVWVAKEAIRDAQQETRIAKQETALAQQEVHAAQQRIRALQQEAVRVQREAEASRETAHEVKLEAQAAIGKLTQMLMGAAQQVVSLQRERAALGGNADVLESMSLAAIATLHSSVSSNRDNPMVAAMKTMTSKILPCITCTRRTATFGYHCGHVPYCGICLEQARRHNMHQACPMCRARHNPFEIFGLRELAELGESFDRQPAPAAAAQPQPQPPTVSLSAILKELLTQPPADRRLVHKTATHLNQYPGVQLEVPAAPAAAAADNGAGPSGLGAQDDEIVIDD